MFEVKFELWVCWLVYDYWRVGNVSCYIKDKDLKERGDEKYRYGRGYYLEKKLVGGNSLLNND